MVLGQQESQGELVPNVWSRDPPRQCHLRACQMQILRPRSRPPGSETLAPSAAIPSRQALPGGHLRVRSTGLGKPGVLQGGGKSLLEVRGHEFRVKPVRVGAFYPSPS